MPAKPAPRQLATSHRSVNTSHQATTTSLCFFLAFSKEFSLSDVRPEEPSRTPRSSSSTSFSSLDRKRCEKVSPERDTKKKYFSHDHRSSVPLHRHYLGPVV
ncbi:hypothetical protein Pmani_026361 [Petrolisthes manimaculis]|uniref:Uncharacterized protein n=1 Tax=Petrolisthes manimaculis TaxID=1843537 RepID=A0AAE1P4Z5_9EUCA|nr:hypothetical protein Pmani_026361 [Petrolisthes manimaculis]